MKVGAWALIIAGCFGAVIYNTALVFIAYFSYDVNVDVKITPKAELLFPAVTICNLTPINKEALQNAAGVDDVKNVVGGHSGSRRRKRASKTHYYNAFSIAVKLLFLRLPALSETEIAQNGIRRFSLHQKRFSRQNLVALFSKLPYYATKTPTFSLSVDRLIVGLPI